MLSASAKSRNTSLETTASEDATLRMTIGGRRDHRLEEGAAAILSPTPRETGGWLGPGRCAGSRLKWVGLSRVWAKFRVIVLLRLEHAKVHEHMTTAVPAWGAWAKGRGFCARFGGTPTEMGATRRFARPPCEGDTRTGDVFRASEIGSHSSTNSQKYIVH